MSADIPLLAAFVAGMVSIVSPCVLPLLPIYLAHLAGVSVGQDDAAARRRVLANAAAYVLGFSVVFVMLGVALGAAGALVDTGAFFAGNRFWLVRLGGALLIVLGLHQLGIIRIPLFERERRIATDGLPPGQLTSSFAIGMTFGAGWSPCVGPILGAILTMAAGQGSVERAGVLLAAYAAGLAVPFLLAAVAWGSSPGVIHALNRRLGLVTSVSGGVMLAIGAIMVLGLYQQFFARLVAISPWVPWEPGL
ncbi:MAG: cytochrome c biogenesis CcdA family protein [Chloroflexota bacterium]